MIRLEFGVYYENFEDIKLKGSDDLLIHETLVKDEIYTKKNYTNLMPYGNISYENDYLMIHSRFKIQNWKTNTLVEEPRGTFENEDHNLDIIPEISISRKFTEDTLGYLNFSNGLHPQNLEKLGFNNIIRQEINETINKWKRENPEEKSPKLKWIKTECSQASYLVIKLTLFMDYGIKI